MITAGSLMSSEQVCVFKDTARFAVKKQFWLSHVLSHGNISKIKFP